MVMNSNHMAFEFLLMLTSIQIILPIVVVVIVDIIMIITIIIV